MKFKLNRSGILNLKKVMNKLKKQRNTYIQIFSVNPREILKWISELRVRPAEKVTYFEKSSKSYFWKSCKINLINKCTNCIALKVCVFLLRKQCELNLLDNFPPIFQVVFHNPIMVKSCNCSLKTFWYKNTRGSTFKIMCCFM